MIVVHEDSLAEVYDLAIAQRFSGEKWVLVELEPLVPVSKYVQLWEGILGEVVGRKYFEEVGTFNDLDLPGNRTLRAVVLRVRIADVVEAMRRFKLQEKAEINAPVAANRIAPKRAANTAR